MPPEGDSRWEQVFGVSGDGYLHTCSPGGGCDPQLNFCGNILVIRSESDFYPELSFSSTTPVCFLSSFIIL